MGKLANFRPSQNGLHYQNSWQHEPDLKLPTPFGSIGIGDAANGLCGGMAFAVRDLFEAHEAPPTSKTNPTPDSPAFNYIVGRLFDSFDIPAGVAQYYEWMNTPRHDTHPLVFDTRDGLSKMTINGSMPILRQTIDSGHPCPLALVCVYSTNPGDLGKNHQVLAYGYEDNGSNTTVWVYDSNHPDNDDVTISFDHTNPEHTTDFNYSTGDHTIFGFFTVPFTAKNPAPLFEDGTTPPTGWISPAKSAVLAGNVKLAFMPFPDVDRVDFSAYYATDPAHNAGIAWRAIGSGVRQADGSFALTWNSASVPDQGNAGLGTINLAAVSYKAGVEVPPRVYELVSTKNNVVYTPPKVMVTTVTPDPIPLNKQVSITVKASDKVSGAPVTGTVKLIENGAVVHTAQTNTPFSYRIVAALEKAARAESGKGTGTPDPKPKPVLPELQVSANGYTTVTEKLDVAD